MSACKCAWWGSVGGVKPRRDACQQMSYHCPRPLKPTKNSNLILLVAQQPLTLMKFHHGIAQTLQTGECLWQDAVNKWHASLKPFLRSNPSQERNISCVLSVSLLVTRGVIVLRLPKIAEFLPLYGHCGIGTRHFMLWFEGILDKTSSRGRGIGFEPYPSFRRIRKLGSICNFKKCM